MLFHTQKLRSDCCAFAACRVMEVGVGRQILSAIVLYGQLSCQWMDHSPQHTNTNVRGYPVCQKRNDSLGPHPPPSAVCGIAVLFRDIICPVFMFFLGPHYATRTALPKFTRDFHITKFRVSSVFFLFDLWGVFSVVYHCHILETAYLDLWDTPQTSVTGCSCLVSSSLLSNKPMRQDFPSSAPVLSHSLADLVLS